MIRYALTSRTAADFGPLLAKGFRDVIALLLGVAIMLGLGHGPWAADVVVSVLLAMVLFGTVTGLIYAGWRWAHSAAWRSVLGSAVRSDPRRTIPQDVKASAPCTP